MLVKELVSTFKPSSPREKIYFVFYNEEGELCLSNDYDFVIDVLGGIEVIGWRIVRISDPGRFGSFDNELHIMCNSVPVSDDVVETDEEFEERNQKFLESLNEMPDPSKYDTYDIRNLPVDKGVINPLIKAGVKTLGDLKTMSAEELSLIPRISNKRIEDIKDALYRYGLYLKQD